MKENFENSKLYEGFMKQNKAISEALNSMNTLDKTTKKIVEAKPVYPEFPKIDPKVLRNYNLADFKYEKIKEKIENFQKELTEEYDVMIQMATFGKEIIMSVDDIGYQNPDLLYFHGTINGQKAQLIQHQSQLNFLLLACKKEDPRAKPKRIGFYVEEKTEEIYEYKNREQ